MFAAWKPVLSALVQPPGSLLLLVLLGLALMGHRQRRYRRVGAGLIGTGTVLLWLICCNGTARWLQDDVLHVPPALTGAQLLPLTASKPAAGDTAIVVLGAGRHTLAAEYGQSNLTHSSLLRLRYGVWLARRTGLPLAYSGGVGWAQQGGPSEAEVAGRIAREDWATSIRWLESTSRDTRENANLTVPMLRAAGVRRIVLVTHASHMPRALKMFEQAASKGQMGQIELIAAPLGFVTPEDRPLLDWLPSASGYQQVHALLHELIGLAVGT